MKTKKQNNTGWPSSKDEMKAVIQLAKKGMRFKAT